MFGTSPSGWNSESSEEEDQQPRCKVPKVRKEGDIPATGKPSLKLSKRPESSDNIIHKLVNREHFGKFHSRPNGKSNESPFKTVPDRLRFCLRDILPYCYLDNHVFMGLSACGQFLLSFTVSFEEEELTQNYSFTNGYKYKLFFWIYRPNSMLTNFYQVCLFDDHGVDNMKNVSMTQWVTNPRLLIVHGASDNEHEESYVTYVAVPKLGCRECSEIRKSESDDTCRTDTLCVRCNLTIHTKYTRTDSDPKLSSQVNFNHPDYLVMVSNGFIHALNIQLEKPTPQRLPRALPSQSYAYQQFMFAHPAAASPMNNNNLVGLGGDQTMNEIELNFSCGGEREERSQESPWAKQEAHDCGGPYSEATTTDGLSRRTMLNNKTEDASSLVANIIADFAECETKPTLVRQQQQQQNALEKTRIFSRTDRKAEEHQLRANNSTPLGPPNTTNGAVINHHPTNHNIHPPPPPPPSQSQMRLRRHSSLSAITGRNMADFAGPSGVSGGGGGGGQKVDSYEFSEEAEEKCEKISLFRKKRLADKKYEFSEDNSENIIPFNRMRTRSTVMRPFLSPGAAATGSPSSPAATYFEMPPHAHRASPNYGFRSPCGSPIGNRCLRSPPTTGFASSKASPLIVGRSPTYVTAASAAFMMNCGGYPAMSPSSSPSGGGATGSGGAMFSPQHQYYFKRFNSLPYVFSSPKRNCELQEILPSNFQSPPMPPVTEPVAGSGTPLATVDEKPVFSKKVVRRFVEETDAASVITNEEDDCISPGYHTSLPMEVHGSCYSVMQMISAASAQKLSCPIVKITQNSFDMDQFTYHVANHVCEKQNKKYGVFYDWACEMVSICQYSGIATCVLAVHFTATDKLPEIPRPAAGAPPTMLRTSSRCGSNTTKSSFFGDRVTVIESEPPRDLLGPEDGSNYDCINCSSNVDCVFHRKHYQCCSLFTWDVATGDWTVVDYGELVEMGKKWRSQSTKKQTAFLRATTKKTANHLRGSLEPPKGKKGAPEGDIEVTDGHLRVLDWCYSKSKETLTDLRNCIEFYRGSVAPPDFNELADFYENISHDEGDEEEEEEEDEDEEASEED